MKRSFEQAIFSFSFGNNNTTLNPYAKDKVFECKTCYKQFASFQALGGHRASHKKPRIEGDENSKPKMHACPICGLEFAIGQALGGHMRRHRPIHPGQKQLKVKKGFGFDLNEPALAEAEEEIGEDDCCRQIGPTFDFMGIGPITVDCIV